MFHFASIGCCWLDQVRGVSLTPFSGILGRGCGGKDEGFTPVRKKGGEHTKKKMHYSIALVVFGEEKRNLLPHNGPLC